MIACTECGKQVSTRAKSCPSCGAPVDEPASHDPVAADIARPSVVPDETGEQSLLLQVRRSAWDVTLRWVLLVAAVPLLIVYVPHSWWHYGWPLPVLWLVVLVLNMLYRRYSFVLRIYPDRVSVIEGLWSKEITEFFIKDIRSIDVKQGIWGRLVNVGDVTISTAATVDAAEVAAGVPGPGKIKDLLIARRQKS